MLLLNRPAPSAASVPKRNEETSTMLVAPRCRGARGPFPVRSLAPVHPHAMLMALVALLALPSSGCHGPGIPRGEPAELGLAPERLAEIRAKVARLVDDKHLAGAVTLIARRGKVAWFDTVGFRDVEERAPMEEDTIFRICSMSKPVTSVAVMMLVEEGKIALDDPASKYVPEFAEPRVARQRSDATAGFEVVPAGSEITIRQLLTHTSGLVYGLFGLEYFSDAYRDAGISDGIVETDGTIGDNVRKIAKVPLAAEPGSAWIYGLSTDVLGHIVEVASGQTLEDFLETRIFTPLGMVDTGFRVRGGDADRLARVYQPRAENDAEIVPLPNGTIRRGAAVYSATYPLTNGGYFSGGAGLVSTATDYARFLLMLRNGGELDGARILRPETVAQMTTHQCGELRPAFASHGDGFGFGFGVVTDAAPADAGLGGVGTYSWGGFYYTYFWVDPKNDVIGLFLSQLQPWGKLDAWNDFRKGVYAALAEVPAEAAN
jgi:CubicO group peptidase (beta-lactamase class C family)